nr:capsid protein [Rat picobirnavirus]
MNTNSVYNNNNKGNKKNFKNKKNGKKKFSGNCNDGGQFGERLGTHDEFRGKTTNDPRYYAKSESLLRDSASFSYNTATGTQLKLTDNIPSINAAASIADASAESVPGIWKITLLHAPGVSTSEVSPVNVGARLSNRETRKANSGSRNYDTVDQTIYYLAMADLYSWHSFLRRAYGVLSYYIQKNRYTARALLLAMGLDYDDFAENIADFRLHINALGKRINALAVPKNLTLFDRRYSMYSYLYSDSSSPKAQTYFYQPAGFYVFTPTAESSGGSLTFNVFANYGKEAQIVGPGNLKFTDIITYGNNMLNPILADQDMNTMSGDIEKAFGNDLFAVPMVEIDYAVRPVWDLYMMGQIQNSFAVGLPVITGGTAFNTSTLNISQGNDLISYNPLFMCDTPTPWLDRIFTLHVDDATPSQSMEASRLSATASITNIGYSNSTSSPTIRYRLRSCGSEIASTFVMYFYSKYDNGTTNSPHVLQSSGEFTSGLKNGNQLARPGALMSGEQIAAMAEAFDMHPTLYWWDFVAPASSTGTGYFTYTGFQTDIDNYRIMTANDLSGMDETALLSEFNVSEH